MPGVTVTVNSVAVDKNASMPRLKITGYYKCDATEDANVIGGVAHVTLGGAQFPPIAFASGELLGWVLQRNSGNNFELFLWPDSETMRGIERSKLETTVDLQIQLRFATMGANQRIDSSFGQMPQPFTIKTRDWIGILEGFGIGSRWQATVVVPTGPLAAPFQEMESQMKQAFTHLITGNYPEVLVSSRKALEKLWNAVGETTPGSSSWPANGRFRGEVLTKLDAPNVAKPGNDPYSTKLYRYAESLYKLHHMGAHDGYVVTKAVSEACYSGSLLLLQAVSEGVNSSV